MGYEFRDEVAEIYYNYITWNEIVDDLKILFEDAPKELFADREFMLAALTKTFNVIHFAADELLCDREFFKRAVEINPDALEFASKEIRADREIVLAAVSVYGYGSKTPLKYVAKEFCDDKEIVMAAVYQFSKAIVYASDRLKGDKDVAISALYSDFQPFGFPVMQYISHELHSDEDVAIAASYSSKCNYTFIPPDLREEIGADNDYFAFLGKRGIFWSDWESIWENMLKKGVRILENAPSELLSDRDFIYFAIAIDYYSLKYATDEIKADKEFIIEAVKINGYALTFASPEVQADPEVQAAANYTHIISSPVEY